ncbi:MAG: hypothetical protein MK212_03750 [Saprospiraceae bacterium]|nr:hypothetical protein [Saprospiraceae bacterium]
MLEAENKISAQLTEDAIQEIAELVKQIKGKLPFLLELSANDRAKIPTVDRTGKAFISDALDAARAKNAVLPEYVSVDELEKDLKLFEALSRVLAPLAELYASLEDTKRVAGAEAYTSAMVIYNMFQMAAKMGVGEVNETVMNLTQSYLAQRG